MKIKNGFFEVLKFRIRLTCNHIASKIIKENLAEFMDKPICEYLKILSSKSKNWTTLLPIHLKECFFKTT